MGKKIFLLLFIFVLIIIVVILIIFTNTGGSKNNIQPTITPFGQQNQNPNAVSGSEPAQTTQDQELARRSGLVTELIGLLPHHGVNFSMYYSYSLNQFTLYINPQKQAEGNAEFDAFLQKNGVLSRTWIPSLFLTYITPTPSSAPKNQNHPTPVP
jgi:hypothetical protein